MHMHKGNTLNFVCPVVLAAAYLEWFQRCWTVQMQCHISLQHCPLLKANWRVAAMVSCSLEGTQTELLEQSISRSHSPPSAPEGPYWLQVHIEAWTCYKRWGTVCTPHHNQHTGFSYIHIHTHKYQLKHKCIWSILPRPKAHNTYRHWHTGDGPKTAEGKGLTLAPVQGSLFDHWKGSTQKQS